MPSWKGKIENAKLGQFLSYKITKLVKQQLKR
jgi:hypothetical protein